jgi:hypothetical protein
MCDCYILCKRPVEPSSLPTSLSLYLCKEASMSSPRLAEIEADAYEKKPQQSRQLRASDAAETPTDSAQGSPACGCSDTSPKVPTCLSQVGTDRQAGCLIALYHAQIIQRASPAMDRRIDGTGPHRPAQTLHDMGASHG